MNPTFAQTTSLVKVNTFIRSVYNWMTIGLVVTGFTSFFVSRSPGLLQMFYGNPVMPFVLFIGLIILCGYLSARIQKIEASTATGLYVALTIAYGVILTPIFLIYTAASIVSTFFHLCSHIRRSQCLRMVTKKISPAWPQFFDDGLDRHHYCHGGEHLHRLYHDADHHIHDCRADFHGPDRV